MMNPQHSCPSPGDESRLSVLFQWRGSVPSSEDCSWYSVHQTTESEPCVMSKTFIFHTAHTHTLAGVEMLLKMQSRRWDETLQRAVGLFHLCGNGPGRIHLVESGGCKEPLKDKGRTEIKLLYLLVVTPRSSSSSSVVTGESVVVMWILVDPRGAWWSLMEPPVVSLSRLQLKDYLFHFPGWRICSSSSVHSLQISYHSAGETAKHSGPCFVCSHNNSVFTDASKMSFEKVLQGKKIQKKNLKIRKVQICIEKKEFHWKKNIKEKKLLLRIFFIEKKLRKKTFLLKKKNFFYSIFFFLKNFQFFNWK